MGFLSDGSFGIGSSINIVCMDGFGSHFKGKPALFRRLMLMKFPMAPQSIRAVVLMISVPVASLMERQIVHSLGKATSTWKRSWEEDIVEAHIFLALYMHIPSHPIIIPLSFSLCRPV